MGGLFRKPKPPAPPKPVPMPDEEEAERARMRRLNELRQQSGLQSTLLSEGNRETLG